jgi:hypothetical protein
MKSLVRRRIQIPVLLGLIVVFFLFASWIRPRQVLDGQEGDRHLKAKPQQFSVQSLGISNASIIHVSRCVFLLAQDGPGAQLTQCLVDSMITGDISKKF